ncbi:S41 family peptidase, partial [Xanthomonas campestris]|uniref:S41 family peptidase n=1 Tax=Xanthomonas campestris TaxID=339 RepID=UPI0032E4A039
MYLLSSQQTFLAAEDVAYALQALARATVVGEVTACGAHPSRGFKISNQVVAVVPYARLVSPITRGNLERSGVIPDGVMARLVGLVPAVVIGGCVTLGVV